LDHEAVATAQYTWQRSRRIGGPEAWFLLSSIEVATEVSLIAEVQKEPATTGESGHKLASHEFLFLLQRDRPPGRKSGDAV